MRALLVAVLLSLLLPTAAQEIQTDGTLVVFYRPAKHRGRASTPSVFLDGKELARIDNGRYFSIYLSKGDYLVQGLNSIHAGGIVTKFTVTDSTVYVEADASTYRDIYFEVREPRTALEKLKSLKPLDKKWVRDDRVVFDLPPAAHASRQELCYQAAKSNVSVGSISVWFGPPPFTVRS